MLGMLKTTMRLNALGLHRLKDEAARGLYQQAGFRLEKEDCWLVGWFDDRRNLLSKFIPKRKDPLQQAKALQVDPEEEAIMAEF